MEYEIFAETFDGKHVTVAVNENDTIAVLKTKACRVIGGDYRADQMTIIFNRNVCDDSNTLKSYSIQKGCSVTCVMRVKGG